MYHAYHTKHLHFPCRNVSLSWFRGNIVACQAGDPCSKCGKFLTAFQKVKFFNQLLKTAVSHETDLFLAKQNLGIWGQQVQREIKDSMRYEPRIHVLVLLICVCLQNN